MALSRAVQEEVNEVSSFVGCAGIGRSRGVRRDRCLRNAGFSEYIRPHHAFGSFTPASERAKPTGNVAAGSQVSFVLSLSLRDAAGAQALTTAVSTPGSAQYRHYLTDAQWTARFGPTQAAVTAAENWLRSEGFKIGKVPADRLFVPATGTAAQVASAFNTTLGEYTVKGQHVRLASTPLSIPASISGAVAGVVGVNEEVATNTLAQQLASVSSAKPTAEPPPPAAFRNPQPCSNAFELGA